MAIFVKMSAPTIGCHYLWNNSYIPYGTEALIALSHLVSHM